VPQRSQTTDFRSVYTNIPSLSFGIQELHLAFYADALFTLLRDIVIQEASSCKYLGVILRSDLIWADQVNYMVKKSWKALHFTMRILKKGNSNTKSLAYTSLVRPILEYGGGVLRS
jgi:hypothetical protein